MSNKEKAVIRVLDAVDTVINGAVRIFLILVLIISGFSLYDTYQIYNDASSGNRYYRYRPLSDDTAGLSFGQLQKQNPDVVGWLTLEDTKIDYPVVQGETNSTYLNRDVLGNYSLSGSIFLDCNSASDFSDPYTLVYGHHMDQEVMFGGLDHFTNPIYFDTHKSGTLWVSDTSYYELTVVACLITDAYDDFVFQTGEQSEAFLKDQYTYIKENAVCLRDEWEENEPLLGLSTCSTAGTNERTVVFCTRNRLLQHDDEEETDETSD